MEDDLTGPHLCKSNACGKRGKESTSKEKGRGKKDIGEAIIIDNNNYQEGDIKYEGNARNSKSDRIL